MVARDSDTIVSHSNIHLVGRLQNFLPYCEIAPVNLVTHLSGPISPIRRCRCRAEASGSSVSPRRGVNTSGAADTAGRHTSSLFHLQPPGTDTAGDGIYGTGRTGTGRRTAQDTRQIDTQTLGTRYRALGSRHRALGLNRIRALGTQHSLVTTLLTH